MSSDNYKKLEDIFEKGVKKKGQCGSLERGPSEVLVTWEFLWTCISLLLKQNNQIRQLDSGKDGTFPESFVFREDHLDRVCNGGGQTWKEVGQTMFLSVLSKPIRFVIASFRLHIIARSDIRRTWLPRGSSCLCTGVLKVTLAKASQE